MNNILGWISLGLNLLILIVATTGFIKVMKNDLVHLNKNLLDIKGDIKNLFSKLNDLCQRVANIEGRLKD